MQSFVKTLLVPPLRQIAIGALLDGFYGLQKFGIGKAMRGCGAIFMLHLVRPQDTRKFRPNAHLEVTPEFLDAALVRLKADGYDFIAMDDVAERLKAPAGGRPFAVFTLDDGYVNNLEIAAPIFARHNVPFSVFVTSGFATGTHSMWWETLAELLNTDEKKIDVDLGTGLISYPLDSVVNKHIAFDTLADLITSGDEAIAVTLLDACARRHGIDAKALTRNLVMNEAQLKQLAALPLASLGAHTISHRGLCGLNDTDLEREISISAGFVEDISGKKPASFAYPYGDRRSVTEREVAAVEKAGFASAVSTDPSTLTEARIDRACALPRVALNGYFQKPRYVSVLASGLPFMITRRRDGLG